MEEENDLIMVNHDSAGVGDTVVMQQTDTPTSAHDRNCSPQGTMIRIGVMKEWQFGQSHEWKQLLGDHMGVTKEYDGL